MKILRWLLSHSFLILLIVVVIYGYMFWGNLLGKETPAGKAVAYLSDEFDVVEDFVNAVRTKQAKLNGDQVSDQAADSQVSATADTNDASDASQSGIDQVAQTDEPAAEPVTETVVIEETTEIIMTEAPAEQQAEQSTAQAEPEITSESAAQIEPQVDTQVASGQTNTPAQASADESAGESSEETPMAVDAQPVAGSVTAAEVLAQSQIEQEKVEQGIVDRRTNPEQGNIVQSDVAQSSDEQSFVPPEVEKQLGNVDKQGRVIDETQDDENRNDEAIKADWIIARKSFYQRNYELSEQSYQKVIENSQDNFDAYGELGNVYFNQGKKQQAASAYFEAAAILVRKGQVSRAKSLMGLLRHLDKSKANELRQLIDSTMSS